MSEPVLEAKSLTKSYVMGGRALDVLRGVDLTIHAGESLAIVGSSGAGKSTLLHLLGLLDRPTTGQVLFRGSDVGSLSRTARSRLRQRHIGFVFQFYHLIPELNALENVLLPLMMKHSIASWFGAKSAERERGRALLARLGLSERAGHRPSQLSGGERQRVAIGRALIGDPDVVLCDEPTGNLDEATSREISDLLFELKQDSGKTFVFVTHDLELAQRADRVVRLVHGRVEPFVAAS
ncbi:MAG: ABC transporter ATP-binding protein [Planctomycetes bacterium]|nr:ABC transporter ATP-binding protein [Planctomycetota bacterium]